MSDSSPSIDSLSLAVVVLDEALCISWMNLAAEQLLGESRRSLLGKPWRAALLPSRDLENALSAVLEQSRAIRLFEVSAGTPAGRHLCLELMLSPQERGVLLELRDVAHQQQLAQSVAEASGQQALIDLLQGMAHEIKNPLGGLSGAAQLLRAELRDQPIYHEYLDVILAESSRLSDLVDRMLRPHRETEPKVVNVHRALEHVRQLVQAQAGDQVRIERDYDPSLPEICADENSLVQAFLNIAVNAIEALSGPGRLVFKTRVAQQVTFNGCLHRMVVRVDICDDGPGICSELLSKIFFPLVTTKATGTGLGLSIANTLVGNQQGQISVSSKPGDTRFSLFFPIVED